MSLSSMNIFVGMLGDSCLLDGLPLVQANKSTALTI